MHRLDPGHIYIGVFGPAFLQHCATEGDAALSANAPRCAGASQTEGGGEHAGVQSAGQPLLLCSERQPSWRPPTSPNATHAANDATKDPHACHYTRPQSSPSTMRCSSANAPRRAGAAQRGYVAMMMRPRGDLRPQWPPPSPTTTRRNAGAASQRDVRRGAGLRSTRERQWRTTRPGTRKLVDGHATRGDYMRFPFRKAAATIVRDDAPLIGERAATRGRVAMGGGDARRCEERVIRSRSTSRTLAANDATRARTLVDDLRPERGMASLPKGRFASSLGRCRRRQRCADRRTRRCARAHRKGRWRCARLREERVIVSSADSHTLSSCQLSIPESPRRTTRPGSARSSMTHSATFVAHHDAPLIAARAARRGRGAMEGGDEQ